MEYLAIKDNQIIGRYAGGHPLFDEVLQVNFLEGEEFNVKLGDDIRIYKDLQKGIKKTDVELIAENFLSREEYNTKIDLFRQTAYKEEADPLGMQVLRGDLDKKEWLAKIEEIKKRYPKEKK